MPKDCYEQWRVRNELIFQTPSVDHKPDWLPDKIRLTRDIAIAQAHPNDCIMKAGETAEYFKHSDVYTFAMRSGWTPWVRRRFVEINYKDMFVPIDAEL